MVLNCGSKSFVLFRFFVFVFVFFVFGGGAGGGILKTTLAECHIEITTCFTPCT